MIPTLYEVRRHEKVGFYKLVRITPSTVANKYVVHTVESCKDKTKLETLKRLLEA